MSKISLDLSQFKHVGTKGDHTTLRHKDGHELTLNHKAMPEAYRKQLESLKGVAEDAATPLQADQAKHKFAEGGEIEPKQSTVSDTPGFKKAAKGAIKGANAGGPSVAQAIENLRNAFKAEGGMIEDRAHYANGTPDAQPEDAQEQAQGAADLNMAANMIAHPLTGVQDLRKASEEAVPKGPSAEHPVQVDVAGMAPPPAQPGMDQAAAPQPEAPSAPAMPAYTGGGDLAAAERNEIQGVQGVAAAQARQAEESSKAVQKTRDAQAVINQEFGDKMKALDAEHAAVLNDYKNSYIDPERYWKGDAQGNGSHSKIQAGIAMLLAGFNPTNSPNAAIQYIQHQMDKNIEAQAMNLKAKDNLLAHNMQRYGNMRDALAATRLAQNDMLAHDLQIAADKAQGGPNGIAAMTAKAKIGEIQKQNIPLKMQIATNQLMLDAVRGNGQPVAAQDKDAKDAALLAALRVRAPEKAAEYEKLYVPGYGFAKTPVDNATREQLSAHNKLEVALADLQSFTAAHNWADIAKDPALYAIGIQKSALVQQQARESTLGTVFRESEKPLLNKIISPNPLGLLKDTSIIPKIQELRESNQRMLRSAEASHGLTPRANTVAPRQAPGQGGQQMVIPAEARKKFGFKPL